MSESLSQKEARLRSEIAATENRIATMQGVPAPHRRRRAWLADPDWMVRSKAPGQTERSIPNVPADAEEALLQAAFEVLGCGGRMELLPDGTIRWKAFPVPGIQLANEVELVRASPDGWRMTLSTPPRGSERLVGLTFTALALTMVGIVGMIADPALAFLALGALCIPTLALLLAPVFSWDRRAADTEREAAADRMVRALRRPVTVRVATEVEYIQAAEIEERREHDVS